MLIFSHISLSMLGPCHNLSRPVMILEQKETDGAGPVLVLHSFFLFAWTMAKPKLLTKKHGGLKQHGCGCCSKLDPFSHLMFL